MHAIFIREDVQTGLQFLVPGIHQLLTIVASNITLDAGFFRLVVRNTEEGDNTVLCSVGNLTITSESDTLALDFGTAFSIKLVPEGIKIFVEDKAQVTADNISVKIKTLETTLTELSATVVTSASVDIANAFRMRCAEFGLKTGIFSVEASNVAIKSGTSFDVSTKAVKVAGSQAVTIGSVGGTTIAGASGIVLSTMPVPTPPLTGMSVIEAPAIVRANAPTVLLGPLPSMPVALGVPTVTVLQGLLTFCQLIGPPLAAACSALAVLAPPVAAQAAAVTSATAALGALASQLPIIPSKTVIGSL